MNIYIWQSVRHCSNRYHPEGGVVVIANDEDQARHLAYQSPGCSISPDEKPDHVRPCSDGDAQVFIFPDAGCC